MGIQLELSEQKIKYAGAMWHFCSTLNTEKVMFSEFYDLKTFFFFGLSVFLEMKSFSVHSKVTSELHFTIEHITDHSLTRKWLILMSQCLHIFRICGIHSLEATNWSII